MATKLETDPLWQRLVEFDIDQCDAALPFSKRLARDNGWSERYATRVIFEYKRFLYLTASQDRPVTPSDEVDQAWHMHLLYSRNYWESLCTEVLRQDLHHGPTEGGVAEGKKYRAWYSRTLKLYEDTFGTPPPADIWPTVDDRFSSVESFRRINTAKNIVLGRTKIAATVTALSASFIAGCASIFDENPKLAIAILGLLLIGAIALMFSGTSDKKGRRHNGNDSGSGCAGCGGCGGCS